MEAVGEGVGTSEGHDLSGEVKGKGFFFGLWVRLHHHIF
jgi:hypothetical protein